MKQLLVLACGIFCAAISHAQSCDCEKEFIHIRNIVEKNFAGFADRVKALSPEVYKKTADDLQQLTRNRFSSDNCPLIINKYLDLFKSHHLGFSLATDPYKTDTDYISKRPLYPLSNKAINVGSGASSWEGNYVFTTDTLYSIAVVKDSNALHDYIGVVLTSKIPTWKKGMIKFEGKRVNDSLLTGLLYMRNHRPKIENFLLWDNKNKIGGDWIRMGSSKEIATAYPKMQQWSSWPNLNAAKLSPHTFYMRIGSFGGNARQSIDSMLAVHAAFLDTTPNLVLDLRSNAGGADEAWEHLLPLLYTNPIKMIGADTWPGPASIDAYKQYLSSETISSNEKVRLARQLADMQAAAGKWIKHNEDETIDSLKPAPYPSKIVILIDRFCGSATEEFLLAAKQSTKVILMGENTIGNLDYSNTVQTPFSCYPYQLTYASTRSRRLNMGQGIDNIGIAPDYRLTEEEKDWVKAAVKMLEP